MRLTSCIKANSAATLSEIVDIPGDPDEPVKAIHFFEPVILFFVAVVSSGLRKAASTKEMSSSRLTRASDGNSRQATNSERSCEISKVLRPNNSSMMTITRCSVPSTPKS